MLSFKQYLVEGGRAGGYSGATWKFIVLDKDGKAVEPFQFYDKSWEADKKAKEVGGIVKKVRY